MPSKNTRKTFTPQSYYHIYNRGINKQDIFLDKHDYNFLFLLFSRYLDGLDTQVDFDKVPYKKYNKDVEINCYCIMKNHYHLLVHIGNDTGSISAAMQSIWTSYTKYFNRKYDRVGPLFQERYKASRIQNDEHLLHVVNYIHLNPASFSDYKYSSIKSFTGFNSNAPGWLAPQRLAELIDKKDYLASLTSQANMSALGDLEGQAS